MYTHLGYSIDNIREIEKQEDIYEINAAGAAEDKKKEVLQSRTKLFTCSLLSVISLVLIIFGLSHGHPSLKFASINNMIHTSLALLTDAEMPKPFYVIRNDVDHNKMMVQSAFYNFWFLKEVALEYTNSDDGSKYEVSFFEKVSKTDQQGNKITLGYFSPVIPEGQPSNVFTFQYGDLCKEHVTGVRDDHIDGTIALKCGISQEITGVKKIDACTYKVEATTPQMCSPKEVYSFLNEKVVEVSDGSWWNYQINFFKKGHGSHLYKYHVGTSDSSSERIHLGSITDSLNADGTLQFISGAVCKDEVSGWKTLPREGSIHVECGCELGLKDITEISQCKYDITVAHPGACSDGEEPPSCEKLNLRAELMMMKSPLRHKPSRDELGKYPHNLMHPKFTVDSKSKSILLKAKKKQAVDYDKYFN